MAQVHHRTIETNGINMHIAQAGSGPLVVLCHGFPESWYSWRHQLSAVADAGYHVVAPDQRGYGRTDAPAEVDVYTQFHLVGGDRDLIRMNPGYEAQMRAVVPNLRDVVLLPGIGHWTQQEAPDAVNRALIGFLKSLD